MTLNIAAGMGGGAQRALSHTVLQSSFQVQRNSIQTKHLSLTKKVALVAAAILGSLIFVATGVGALALIGFGVSAGYRSLKEKYDIAYRASSPVALNKKMKEKEVTAKYQALTGVLSATQAELVTSSYEPEMQVVEKLTEHVTSNLASKAVFETHLFRTLQRSLARQGQASFDKPALQAIAQRVGEWIDGQESVVLTLQGIELYIRDAPDGVPPAVWSAVKADPQLRQDIIEGSRSITPSMRDHESGDLKNHLRGLYAIVEANRGDENKTNLELLLQLRKILELPAYQALKTCTSDPAIRFIHELNAAMYLGVSAPDTFKELGEGYNASVVHPRVDGGEGAQMADLFEQSWQNVSTDLYIDGGDGKVNKIMGKVIYAISHPAQAMLSIASHGGTLRTLADVSYDAHAAVLANNPSVQGVLKSTVTTGDGRTVEARVTNVATGSPTIDDAIAPEYLALLQAIENQQFAEEIDQIEGLPNHMVYTNYQKMFGHGEGERSASIMKLNSTFPLSFFGTTLTKDTKFHEMKEQQGGEDVPWTGSEAYSREIQDKILHDATFDLSATRLSDKNNGFYLPGTKATWTPIISQIMVKVQKRFAQYDTDTSPTGRDAFELRAAMQEYAYLLIQVYTEQSVMQKMVARGIEDPHVLRIGACKECIDRGGAENVKYLYALQEGASDLKKALMTGYFHGRALSTRDRMILKARFQHLLAFLKLVPAEGAREDIDGLFTDLALNITRGDYSSDLRAGAE